jgi:hypothetical protein
VRGDQRRVEVEDHTLRRSACGPRPLARPGARHADRVALTLTDLKQHPPRRRARRDLAEHRDLIAERAQVRDAAPAIGDHHRQIAEHPPRRMRATPLAGMRKAVLQRVRQTDLVGQQREHRGPRTRRQTLTVRHDFYRATS